MLRLELVPSDRLFSGRLHVTADAVVDGSVAKYGGAVLFGSDRQDWTRWRVRIEKD